MFLTQGTTGKPKGVTLSHGALIVQSLAKIAVIGYNEDDVCLFFSDKFAALVCKNHSLISKPWYKILLKVMLSYYNLILDDCILNTMYRTLSS